MNKEKKTLYAELVVDFLLEKKITHVFDLTGGMITFLEDAISKKKGMECVPMHHEQAAGFAAEGYARTSQNFGVAIATSGPGATNLITAIGSCYFDSTPSLFIVGQVHTDNIKKNDNVRQEGFQETDIVSVVKPLTKYAVAVRDHTELIYELEKAHYIMQAGRKGPVLLDIPINFQRTVVPSIKDVKHFYGSKEHKALDKKNATLYKAIPKSSVTKLSTLLKKSKAPLLVVGNGVRLSGTTKALATFAKNNNLPVVTSLLGIDSYINTKGYTGYIGSNGNRDANIIFANADLIIALGTRLDIRQTGDVKFFNPTATVVHVDIDKSSLNYTVKSHLSIESDLSSFFTSMQDVRTDAKKGWYSFIASVEKEFLRVPVYEGSVSPNTLIQGLSLVSNKNTIVAVDVGQNQMWCAQSWKLKQGQRVLFSGGMGAMGFSLPAAIGAYFALPKSDLIVVTGDGGLQINIQELETVRRNNIPMKLFVLNNKSLGMVREFQDLYFNKNYQSTVKGYGHPNFEKIAHAYDFEYVKISTLKKDDGVLQQILAMKGPVFVEVDIDMMAKLEPKIVYGHALDDQAPYLNDTQKAYLESLKKKLKA